MQSARILDPNHLLPLRRGPLSQRAKEPDTPWSIHARRTARLVIVVLVLAGLVWAGSL